MFGYNETILRIDLSSKQIVKDHLAEQDAKKYLGGRGLAAKILFEELRPGIDPLGTENKLVYAAGPLAATGFPLNSRWIVAGKSPSTGIWGEAACGGTFAVQLRQAGYDALVVEGVSDSPVYINIMDDKVQIRDGAELWGKTTLETETAIASDLEIVNPREDNPAVVCVGPAGEKLVRFASVMHTAHRAAGRTGLGAVMGSKKLKAIAVRGTGTVPVANRRKLDEMTKAVLTECATNKSLVWFSKYGQVGYVESLQRMGMLPTKNFQKATFEQAEGLSGETMTATILKRKNTCTQCSIACKREVEVLDAPCGPVIPGYGGPEYESVASLGSLLLIGDIKAVSKENQMCNAYGLDTISTGATIAWIMECYEKGIVTKKDLDGIEAKWGNVDAAIELIDKIAKRDGVGHVLAEGVKRASKTIARGSDRYAMEIKGLEIPMHEPRAKKGLGLSYATSIRGGCHMQAFHDPDVEQGSVAPEIGISKALNRHDTSRDKVDMVKRSQDWVAVTNSLLLCTSPGWVGFDYTRPAFLVEVLNTITSWSFTVDDLMSIGERINNLCRCFNAREGFSRKDDYLPRRFIEESLPDGPSKGQRISQKELDEMLDNYYELRRWDQKTGNPTRAKLEELDLDFAKIQH